MYFDICGACAAALRNEHSKQLINYYIIVTSLIQSGFTKAWKTSATSASITPQFFGRRLGVSDS
jgi:hypothetical protein